MFIPPNNDNVSFPFSYFFTLSYRLSEEHTNNDIKLFLLIHDVVILKF